MINRQSQHSPLITALIEALCKLPSIGPKSAQRMAFYLLQNHRNEGFKIAETLQLALTNISNCQRCNNLTEATFCNICSSHSRDSETICIVEMPGDIIAIEQSGAYKGLYYVLMGRLSPLDGIGPQQLGIDKLIHLISNDNIKEIILALNATVEGEATAFYLSEIFKTYPLNITQLAQGIPFGSELEYMDTQTIERALLLRDKKHIGT